MDLTGVVVCPVDGVAPTRRVFAAVRRGAEEHPLIRPVLDALGTAARAWSYPLAQENGALSPGSTR
jgi:hypothetical protein